MMFQLVFCPQFFIFAKSKHIIIRKGKQLVKFKEIGKIFSAILYWKISRKLCNQTAWYQTGKLMTKFQKNTPQLYLALSYLFKPYYVTKLQFPITDMIACPG